MENLRKMVLLGRSRVLVSAFCLAGLFASTCISSMAVCRETPQQDEKGAPAQDIKTVLSEHDRALLAIPGVVGVYIALLPDGKTPCITVLVTRQVKEIAHELPTTLAGYPVVLEFTAPLRPLQQ